MSIEVKQIDNSELNDLYGGKEFRVPSISLFAEHYRIDNLNLFDDWEKSSKLKKISVESYSKIFDEAKEGKLKGQVLYDSQTNLITELILDQPNIQSSRIFLCTDWFGSRGGSYLIENVRNLSTAVLYQEFICSYLSHASHYQTEYAYIAGASRGYFPQSLLIPKNIDSSIIKSVSSENYRKFDFPMRASYICGQFSSDFRTLNFDQDGYLRSIKIDKDECFYNLDKSSRIKTYSSHNVDNLYQAATLSGIVASYINDLIIRKEWQDKK